MEWKRYKVIERPGGLGEVVQITVRDIGVNSGENTPPLLVKSLKRSMERTKVSTSSHGDDLSPCMSCTFHQERVAHLEAHVQHLEKQMQVNNLLNSLMIGLADEEKKRRVGRSTARRRRPQRKEEEGDENEEERAEDGEKRSALLTMMRDEMQRQNLLHALMNLVERPTADEVAHGVDRLLARDVGVLRRAIPKD